MKKSPELTAALTAARVECQSLGHAFVCTEHLLAGLAAVPEARAATFLEQRGLDVETIRQKIVEKVGRGTQPLATDVTPSLRTLGILRLAEDMARTSGIACDTITLLWALLQDRDADAAQVLQGCGVDLVSWSGALEERMGDATRRRPRVFGGGERPSVQLAEMRRWRRRLQGASDFLNQSMVGQTEAVDRVVSILTRSWAGLTEAGRPLASFLFVGPRGSGKNTMAVNLAELLYGDQDRMIRFNMDEFSDEASALRLTGQGSETSTGLLTEVASEYPYSIFFMEEADRAHARALDTLAAVLTRGHATDGRGNRVEFRDHVVILSVAVDPELMARESPVGFRLSKRRWSGWKRLERELVPILERVLGAELVAAVDELVFFPPLGKEELTELLQTWAKVLRDRLKARRDVNLTIDDSVYGYLLERGEEDGADFLNRLFIREVENLVAAHMLDGDIAEGWQIHLRAQDQSLALEASEPSA